MTAKPKKQKPTKQKFVVEVLIEVTLRPGLKAWTKKEARFEAKRAFDELFADRPVIARVRKVDLD